MKEILNNYKAQVEKYAAAKAEIDAKREQIEVRIEKAHKQLERLEKKENSLSRPSRYNIIDALGEKLSEYYGLSYERYGPFGLECETSIYLRKDISKRISEQPTISIRLRPFGDPENDWMTYDTGERTNRYAKGTIGELNGYNSVYAPLPKDFNEIIKIIESDERNKDALVDRKPPLADVILSCEEMSKKGDTQPVKEDIEIAR